MNGLQEHETGWSEGMEARPMLNWGSANFFNPSGFASLGRARRVYKGPVQAWPRRPSTSRWRRKSVL